MAIIHVYSDVLIGVTYLCQSCLFHSLCPFAFNLNSSWYYWSDKGFLVNYWKWDIDIYVTIELFIFPLFL